MTPGRPAPRRIGAREPGNFLADTVFAVNYGILSPWW
jgi:hypothetical protein